MADNGGKGPLNLTNRLFNTTAGGLPGAAPLSKPLVPKIVASQKAAYASTAAGGAGGHGALGMEASMRSSILSMGSVGSSPPRNGSGSPTKLQPLNGTGTATFQRTSAATAILSSSSSLPASMAATSTSALAAAATGKLDGTAAANAAASSFGTHRVTHGFYAGQLVSEAAFKLLQHGEAEARRVYDKRAREASGGAGVVQGVGANALVDSGAPIQLGTTEGSSAPRGSTRTGRGGAGVDEQQSFIESLRMPLTQLEALANGDFVYLMPIKVKGRHGVTTTNGTVVGHENSYDLRIVDHKHTAPESYFTLSNTGLVHYKGTESDFTPLAQVEREYRLFHSVARVPAFAQYKIWKSFTVWKKAIRSGKRRSASSLLDEALFLLNPILRTGVMRLRRLCNEVAEWGLFAFEKNKTYDLEDFISAQNIRRVQVTTWLTEFAADVRALVRGACDEVLDGFLTANDIRADHKMTFMERAALRHECRKLTKFIRLADFLVKDTLLTMALESTAAVRNYVIPPAVASALANGGAGGEVNPFMMITAPSAVYIDLPPEGSPPGTLPPQNTKKEKEAKAGEDGEKGAGKTAAESKDHHKDKKQAASLGPLFRVGVSLEAGPPEKPGSASARSNASGDPNEEGSLQHGSASEYNQENGNGSADGDGHADGGGNGEEAVDPSYAGLPTPILSLSPSVSQIKSALKSLLYDAMVVISAPPRLLSHPDLAPYTQAASDEGGGDGGDDEEGDEETDLTEAATSHTTYRRMASEMFTGIEAAYAAVHDFCRVFVPCSRTYFSNERDFATVAARFGLDSNLDAFTDAIDVYQGQVSAFQALPSYADIGVIRLDSVSLKRMLIPSPTRCLLSIRDVLPMVIGHLTANLVNTARSMYNVLAGSPGDVDPFVAKIEMLEKVVEMMPELREKESHIRSLAHIMGDNEWPLADDLKAQFRVMKDTLAELDAASQKAEASQDEDIKRFAKQVEAAIPIMKKAVLAIREKMDDAMISSADSPPAKVVKFIREAAVKMDELKAQGAKFQHYQTALRQPVQTFETMDEVASDLAVKLKLWESLQEWHSLTASWKQMPFEKIDAEEMNKQVGNYQKVASRSERALPGNAAAGKLRALVEDFKGLLPVVVDLRNRALQPRHWAEIEACLGTTIDPNKSYTLGELLDMNVVEHQPEISVIAIRASSELALEELLSKKVTTVWTGLEFIVNPYKDSKEVFILGSLEEITAALDESLVTINTILGSRYCGHIRTEVEAYQKRLMLLSETLDEWLNCQKQWMYLEAILFADDIKRDLPDESKKFAAVDRSWKTIMKRTYNNPNALVSGTVKGLKETLVRHNEVLEAIQKSLEAYLEKKRSTFPRFYFLSNDELLEILAQARDPQAVQPHLRKCFDALTRLEFGKDPGSVDIQAMISPEGERVALPKNLNARGAVEYWLKAVQDGMMVALRGLMKEGFNDYQKKERKVWVLSHAGQVVATVAQIMWSYETEAALRHPTDPLGAVAAWYDKNVRQLADLTALVRSNLSKLERKVIVALVTTDVHARDIVEELMNSKTTSVGSFTWQQQLRYYWEDAKMDVAVRQSNALLYYGYEYQGATSRLVITPLTDRCWMTITGACNLKLGAAPAGPAGTGKTESSKDLAKALAIQCIVFNCSDQVDYQLLGKLFAGLAQSGSWTCLDEFNRIDIEVLSVVAQQLQQLRQGLVQGLAVMPFEGRTIVLKPHCVIITMNPGYAGRTELPDNLKVQFRPVAMMVPDYALIAEIILFAEGFDAAKRLSGKMTRLYRLSSEQLSQQRHYDFGMRAVKSVLVMAGALKRANPTLSEDVVLIRAMRDSNVPKFLADDIPLFHALVGDLFPGVVVPPNELGELQVALEEQVHKHGLQIVTPVMNKIIQLYETFEVRFGVVIVGPTGAGKTAAYRLLADAMTTLRERGAKNESFQKVHMHVLNPKSITMGELYGEFNDVTQEWKDGLASSIIRAFSEDETEDRKWTVFDGPIDALWIENMNTVLDDNMMLCLANGQRIKLKTSMRMLFEVQDLEAASPATVSRLGVVYMTPVDLGWMPIVESWLPKNMPEKMPKALHEHIMQLFKTTVDDGLHFRRANLNEPITTSDVQTVTSLLRLLTAMIKGAGEKHKDTGATPGVDFSRPIEDLKKVIDSMFAFSYIWAVGGSISQDGYDKFDNFVRNHRNSILGNIRYGQGTVFDCFADIANGDVPWKRWAEIVPAFSYDREQPYFNMVVPTVDTVRFTWLLTTNLTQLYPVFFTGVTGTGKTVIVSDFLNKASALEYKEGKPVAPVLLNFSARTSSDDTQATMEGKMEKRKRTQLGAPTGKRLVIFVDDVNMPSVETYGAQPPIELLRLLVDMGGVYDRQKLFWKEVVDTVTVAAAAPPGGGRAAITQRFTRHFHMLCVPVASTETFKHIFGSILSGFVSVFADEVKMLAPKIVAATIEVFDKIRENMKPTPAKSHYTFNLRDVSKVFQGMLMIAPKECPNGDVFVRLWMHEAQRVFHDRLISAEDKHWFTLLLVELSGRYLGKSGGGWTHTELFEVKPILFVDFLRPSMDDGPGIYEEGTSIEKVASVLDDALEDYNLSHPTQMKLVFFRDAVEHIARIARILRQPRGNAMLVGVGGSGKQSLTRMACHMANVNCVTLELTRGYDGTAFRDDLKKMMLTTGAKGESLAFLFGDTQIVHESFLEDISNILNTGEVPGLFANDELNKIIEDVRPAAVKLGIPETRDNVYRLFVSRVRANLHIVLAMSPVGNSFRVRCRQFPSLINCCTIDWYSAWPKDALTSVANRFLADEEQIPDELKPAIAEMCVDIHLSVAEFSDRFYQQLQRKVYTTPKSYLDTVNLYLKMLGEKRSQVGELRNTLATGSRKLEETNGIVDSLKAELTKLQPVIDQKSKEAGEMLIQVSKDTAEADKIKVVVEKDAAEVATQAAEVQAIQADAQKDLDVALPALKNAEEALKKLDKKDITEIKAFANPPAAVKTVMEAVLLLLGEKQDWDSAKKVLSRATFMEELITYDRDNVAPNRLKALVKYVENPDMSVEAVSRVSKAATTLCQWVHAVDIYSRVAKEVEPKKKRLEEMNSKLNAANAVLAEKQSALQAVLDKVASLKAQCDEVTAEKERLAHEAQLTKDRLERANKLTSGLSDEGVRWKASVESYDKKLTALTGDVLLSAASISYYGAFTGTYRSEMVASWMAACAKLQIPHSPDYSLMNTLGDPVQVRDWQIAGLPTDAVSTDSAILVTRGRRWPLMIDPQEQAKKWVKAMEIRNKLETTRFTNGRWLQKLEGCLRLGAPLLLEDVGESLDAALQPVLQRATFKQGGQLLIRLGDSDVPFDENFKLYITTKLANPHYMPETCIAVTIINFTVTQSGLVDQLLGAVVRKERPDVEKKKNDLVVSMAKDKKQLKELEDKILKNLRESKGNILDDSALIETLAESKELSRVIADRLKESEKTELEINEMRERYRPVAVRGALIYFVVADLALIDPMYQFSLNYYTGLYNRCIDLAEQSDNFDTRLQNLITYITSSSYANVCRGLFEAHKLLYSFLICSAIMRESGAIKAAEWEILLRGATIFKNSVPNPFPDLLSEGAWNLVAAIDAQIPELKGLSHHIADENNQKAWRDWAMCEEPHLTPLPAPWSAPGSEINAMQKMLVLKVWREEKLMFAIKEFVAHNLGQEYVTAPPTSLADVFKDSREDTPIIFILSVGADPTGMLQTYAKTKGYQARLRLISLGQGQGPRAQQLIDQACGNGDWVLLQNCHLARSWMGSLEKIVESFAERRPGFNTTPLGAVGESNGPIHQDFRLFLTSMPADYFPVPVLQNGIKLTNEPPKGIRANLTRSLAQVDGWSSFDSCGEPGTAFTDGTPKIKVWKRMAFALCFFHAVVQERRKFGPLGFNIRYEINDSDLETSVQVLKMLLVEQPDIPWDALRYVTGQINYGGRVTDDWDRRCMMAILGRYYTVPLVTDDEGYRLSPSGTYYVPPVDSLETYKEYASSLPLNDPPEVFGMNNNANIANQRAETDMIINTALSLQPKSGGGGGGAAAAGPDEIVATLAAEIEADLPGKYKLEEAGPTTFQMKGEHMDSLGTVLSQEIARFNKLIGVMSTSLFDLQRAIRGEVLMSEELDKMYTAFLNNKVPPNWEAAGYLSLKPLASWVRDFHARIAFMREWLLKGQPQSFWLSGFFFPQGFLTGVLQSHARKYQLAIDTLSFSFKMLDIDTPDELAGLRAAAAQAPPSVEGGASSLAFEDGVLIYGLYMESARWNKEKRMIDDSKPGEISAPWPMVHFMPTKDYKTSPNDYTAPVYKTSTRAGVLSTTGVSSSFIVAVDMPTDRNPDYWVYAGSALLLQLNA